MFGGLTIGCQGPAPETRTKRINHPAGKNADALKMRDNCSSLLFELMNEEKNVSKLHLIKHDSSDVHHLINEIADSSSVAANRLEEFRKADPSFALDETELPPGEVATRQAIASTKTKSLLFTRGERFQRELLLSQAEAVNYAAHLSLVAAKNDTNPARIAWLRSLNATMLGYYTRCLYLLGTSTAEDQPAQKTRTE